MVDANYAIAQEHLSYEVLEKRLEELINNF
jgi:hypothetical protein